MISKGMVYLYRFNELVTARSYDSKNTRRKIIKQWERLYAAGYRHCNIRICPTIDVKEIDEDGMNMKPEQIGTPRKKYLDSRWFSQAGT